MANKLLSELGVAVGDSLSASMELQTRSGTATNFRIQVVFMDVSDVVVAGGTFDGEDVATIFSSYAASPDTDGPWFRSRLFNMVVPAGSVKVNIGYAYDSTTVGTITASRKPILNRGAKPAPYSPPTDNIVSLTVAVMGTNDWIAFDDQGFPRKALASGIDLTIFNNDLPDTDFDHDQLTNYDVAQHRIINDAGTLTTELFSASEIITRLATKEASANKNVANGYCPLDASSLVPSANLPGLALTGVSTVANEAAQLALANQEEGDVAIRTDENKTYAHNGGVAGTMADWSELLTPTDVVTSVNSQTGVVVLNTSHISEVTNLYYTEVRVSANTDVAASKVITDWISVTQAVDLDTMESNISTNNAKVSNVQSDLSYTVATGVVANTDGTGFTIPLATTTDRGLMTAAQFDKLGFISVTAAVNLDNMAVTNADNNFSTNQTFNGNLLLDTGAKKLGYTTGSGGAVTQITSRTTGVTLNKSNGAITLVSAAGSASYQTFTVTNSVVSATDTIIINQQSGTDLNMIHITAVTLGSFDVTFATTGGTTTEQPVFNFSIINAVTS